jgi:hypothetical protein
MTQDASTPTPPGSDQTPRQPSSTQPGSIQSGSDLSLAQDSREQASGEQLRSAEREARLKAAQQHDAELREAQYTRKLTLAILSTLQHKGILSPGEIDALLMAARRSIDASFTPSVAVRAEFQPVEPVADPKQVRREQRPPPVFDIQID